MNVCLEHEKVKHITFPVYFTICLAVDDMTKDKSYSVLTTYFPFRYFNSWLEPSSSAEKSLNLGTKKVGNGETRHHWHFSDLIIQPIHCNVCHSLLLTTKGIIFKRLENLSTVRESAIVYNGVCVVVLL